MNIKLLTICGMAMLSFATAVKAQIVLTYSENPGVTTSSLANTSLMTFEGTLTASSTTAVTSSLNTYNGLIWSGVGVYDKIAVRTADQYGGAGGTGYYPVVSSTNLGNISSTTLNLDVASSYFGLWWSAGDSSNVLEFWSGLNGTGTLVAKFTTQTLLSLLPSTYKGNPSSGTYNGQNGNEAYAFLNFFGETNTSGTSVWQSVVFTNIGSSGFESDNHTSRVAAWSAETDGGLLPGYYVGVVSGSGAINTSRTADPFVTNFATVPEPGTAGLLVAGAIGMAGCFWRKFARA